MIHRIFWGNWRMNAGVAMMLLLLALITLAMLFGGWWHGDIGVEVVVPTCSNQSLVFSDPCNSAYVVMRL